MANVLYVHSHLEHPLRLFWENPQPLRQDNNNNKIMNSFYTFSVIFIFLNLFLLISFKFISRSIILNSFLSALFSSLLFILVGYVVEGYLDAFFGIAIAVIFIICFPTGMFLSLLYKKILK